MIRPNYWLIASSSMFIIPSIFGYYRGNKLLSTMSLCSMACSINYWMYPKKGIAKNMDLIVSKATGIIYFIYGYKNINSMFHRFIGYSNLACVINCYYLSCKLYNQEIITNIKTDIWIYYHIGFHISSVIAKMLVLV